MTWISIAELIAKVGLPFAYQVWKNATTGKDPTQADWDVLNTLASAKASDRMIAALARAGIDPNSAPGKILLAATV